MTTVSEEWGMCCPQCKKDDELLVECLVWADLTPDGTDQHLGTDWHPESRCACSHCKWLGTVKEAQIPEE